MILGFRVQPYRNRNDFPNNYDKIIVDKKRRDSNKVR